jgi:glutamate--cysteine ligase catalytic subunit
VEVNVPVFRDEKTPWPWSDPTVNYDLHKYKEDDDVRNGAVKENFIYMDAMAFGMGSCCLQITFQAKNIEEGRKMYDQLSPLGPILLALTAATPVYKGFLADTDVRWNQISNAVDDRTAEELGERVRASRAMSCCQLIRCSHCRPIDGEYPSHDTHRTVRTYHKIRD